MNTGKGLPNLKVNHKVFNHPPLTKTMTPTTISVWGLERNVGIPPPRFELQRKCAILELVWVRLYYCSDTELPIHQTEEVGRRRRGPPAVTAALGGVSEGGSHRRSSPPSTAQISLIVSIQCKFFPPIVLAINLLYSDSGKNFW